MSRTYTGKIHVGQRRVTRANGNVYVYERHTQYDRETQKTVTLKNKLLGKLDPETGEIVPTRPKSRSKKEASASIEHACLADILDLVARETGIDKGLESAFGTAAAQKIATIARYLIATDGAAIPLMEAWQVGPPDALRGRPGRKRLQRALRQGRQGWRRAAEVLCLPGGKARDVPEHRLRLDHGFDLQLGAGRGPPGIQQGRRRAGHRQAAHALLGE